MRALHHLQLVGLLQALYGEVWVPPAGAAELTRVYPDFPQLLNASYAFLRIRKPVDAHTVKILQSGKLDIGEAEAIALAVEIRADYLLIDELRGREEGRSRGLVVTGVIGVLGRAKNRHLIPAVRPLLDELETRLHFFIGKDLKEKVLRQLGE